MNEFKRKQWTRIGLSLIAVVVAVLFLPMLTGKTWPLTSASSRLKLISGRSTVTISPLTDSLYIFTPL